MMYVLQHKYNDKYLPLEPTLRFIGNSYIRPIAAIFSVAVKYFAPLIFGQGKRGRKGNK